MENIPDRQQRILAFLRQYMNVNGYPPTVREIGQGIGVESTSLVSYYLKWLEKQGYIRREASASRAIRFTEDELGGDNLFPQSDDSFSVPFLGYIVASAPIQVEALPGTETVEINRALFGREVENLFALRVKGNSMVDALIGDGDTVILRQQERVENGEMAAVWLTNDTGETTLKKVYYEGERVRLQPANPTMGPIYVPAKHVRIQGKVVMVIRQVN